MRNNENARLSSRVIRLCFSSQSQSHLAPRGGDPAVQKSHVRHAYRVQLFPVHVETHVEGYSDQQPRKQHAENT
jgi:hypothetical protein